MPKLQMAGTAVDPLALKLNCLPQLSGWAIKTVDNRELVRQRLNPEQRKFTIKFRLILSASKPWLQLLSAGITSILPLILLHFKLLHAQGDSARLACKGRLVFCKNVTGLFNIIMSRNQTEGCAMPIELLVPIAIFLLGMVVSVTLSSLGIERVIEANKS